MTHQQARIVRLIEHLHENPGAVTTGQVRDLYDQWGISSQRSTARSDLQHLAATGQLLTVPGHDTAYRLNQAKGDAA